jgi:STE24 endopeptidase
LLLLDLTIGALFLIASLLTGFSIWLRDWAQSLISSSPVVVAVYALAFFSLYVVLITPLNFIGGYVWPHRFGLSTQTFAGWVWDYAKGLLLGSAFMLILIEALYLLLRMSPTWWWLWMGLFYLVFVVILASLAPLILVPLFYKTEPLENRELEQRLTALADQAGARVNGVFRLDLSSKTNTANAALMGLGNTRRIVLGDTLLGDYSVDEIETILAHELGHHVHGDVTKGILLESSITLMGFWLSSVAFHRLSPMFGFEGIADIAALPLLGLILGAFAVATMPLTNGYSRWRERLADQYALESTRKPDAFIAAMTRLANQNLAEAQPARLVEIIFHSHPSISRRVTMAQDFKTKRSG